MADLEAGRGGAGASAVLAPGEDGVVPVQHMRRLTTTLVDILRHVTASSQGQGRERGEAQVGWFQGTRLGQQGEGGDWETCSNLPPHLLLCSHHAVKGCPGSPPTHTHLHPPPQLH